MENPFRFGGELSRADLVKREEEIAEALSTVRSGEKLFLIGPRRYGKTSLLNAAIEQGEAERSPYDIQLLAHTCWNLLLGQKARTLTPGLIVAAGEILIRQNDPVFNSIWSQLSPNQKTALIAVINEEGKMMTSQQALRRYRLAAATILRTRSSKDGWPIKRARLE